MSPEGTDNKASAGYLYPIGGFCILNIGKPVRAYRVLPPIELLKQKI